MGDPAPGPLGLQGYQILHSPSGPRALSHLGQGGGDAIQPRLPVGGPQDKVKLAATIKKLLKEALSSFGPGLLAGQASAIKDDVLRELRAQLAQPVAPAPSSPSASVAGHALVAPAPLKRYVKNLSTGVTHLAAANASGLLPSWTTTCGWKFAARANGEFVTLAEPPCVHKFICEKCLPMLRHSRKVEIQHAMGRQGGAH
jgi:hypothetical protein